MMSHEILDVNKQYELFISLYENVLFDKFDHHFNHETLRYLRYRLEPVKNLFLCSNVLVHLLVVLDLLMQLTIANILHSC